MQLNGCLVAESFHTGTLMLFGAGTVPTCHYKSSRRTDGVRMKRLYSTSRRAL